MNNRQTTVGLISLGCSKNRVDSEMLLGLFAGRGYEIVSDPAQAEIIVVNTCGFIGPAKEESIDAIFDMARYKTGGRLKTLIVTGCLAQRYGEALREEMPEVDAILGVAEYPRIFEAIEAARQGKRPMFTGEGDRFYKARRVLTTPAYSAYVKISDGCDNRCSYCAIPLIRGPYRSRPFEDIVSEAEALCARGVRELTLIAQDTSRYGNDFPGGQLLLGSLIERCCAIEGAQWVRVLYCYPDTVNEHLLDIIAAQPKACRYLDLPLQHINAGLLRRMNRRGSPELIRRLVKACRERDIMMRTTMIVGFPGETEDQFKELMDFVAEARFGRLGAFTYSPEDGTPAAEMPGQIDEAVKQRRLDELMMLQQGISLEQNLSRVGTLARVLVEGVEDGRYVGRSQLEAPEVDGVVRFTCARALKAGEFVDVRISGADAYDLEGEAAQ